MVTKKLLYSGTAVVGLAVLLAAWPGKTPSSPLVVHFPLRPNPPLAH